MGKERYYHYWRGKSSKKRGSEKERDYNNNASGCMSAVFQFFDFHPFHFGVNHHQNSFKFNASFPQEQEPSTVLKGTEAPRNSLELEEASFLSFDKDNDNSAIPIGIQIKTKGDRRSKSSLGGSHTDLSQEILSSSPGGGAKTPTLVARLMGLELLPETSSTLSSPRPSSTLETPPPLALSRSQPPRHPRTATTARKSWSDSETGTRSLPETPRISLGRRSDVDLHHRLSLQINKEKMNSAEDSEFTRFRRKKFKNDVENSRSSPSCYARQIVKQVKENVSRKVGLDITNTAKNGEPGNTNVVRLKKTSKPCSRILEESSPGKHETTSSYSPRLRLVENIQKNHKQVKPPAPALSILQDNRVEIPKMSVKPKLQVVFEENQKNQEKSGSFQKCKKVTVDERFKRPTQKPDFMKNYKQEESFVHPMSQATRVNRISEKKCRKSPVPTLLPVKKDPSPPATKIPSKQPQQVLVLVDDAYPSKHDGTKLSESSSQQKYRHQQQQQQVTTHMLKPRDTPNGATTTFTVSGGELQYISSILKCTGIGKDTQLSLFTECFSPTHPLDPSIFNQIEDSLSNNNNPTCTGDSNIVLAGPLGLKCNRKLIFDLVDEILIGILKPHIRLRPWLIGLFRLRRRECRIRNGAHLVDTLCTRIEKFPSADCQVLEDIDALVDLDIEPMKHYQTTRAFEEVGDFLVTEIERDILHTLIQETTKICGIET